MEPQMARQIIDTLAQGIHPVTGEAMPDDSPYNAPPVIRALIAVSIAIDKQLTAQARKPRELPARAGMAWTDEDDKQLAQGFDAGLSVRELEDALMRTRASVEARLIKLGKVPLTGRVPFGAAPRTPA